MHRAPGWSSFAPPSTDGGAPPWMGDRPRSSRLTTSRKAFRSRRDDTWCGSRSTMRPSATGSSARRSDCSSSSVRRRRWRGAAAIDDRLRYRALRMAPALAGPLLIVGVTLFALRAFAFGGQLTTGDALSLFLPTYCHLGNVLAAGHIPAWNPGTFTGLPFAGDPQSGWMYAPVMLLFTALPCAVAIRWFI